MKLNIEEIETHQRYDRMWLFIEDAESENYRMRWAIAYRKDGWWGVVAMFPSTHENALERIPKEMKLAKKAIETLKTKLLN